MNTSPASDRIHWGAAKIVPVGVGMFSLSIPHFLSEPGPVVWLDRRLADRLRAVEGLRDITVSVRAAVVARGGKVGWDAEGYILLIGLADPWPDVHELHQAVRQAVNEAFRSAAEAQGPADEFVKRLRSIDRDA